MCKQLLTINVLAVKAICQEYATGATGAPPPRPHPPHPLSTPPDPHLRKDTMPAPGPLFCRFSNSKLRLMCAVRAAVARAFDAKLIIVGLGGR